MNNFEYANPVRILFGKGQIAKIGSLIPQGSRVLITYGGGSIRKNGVLDQITGALKSFTVFEFGGIEANPVYETLMKAVAVVKVEKIDFLLAAGGGSVVDGTKFIAAAALYEGADPWEILSRQEAVTKTVPLGAVITLPATGSEMNPMAVITRHSTQEKLANSFAFPQFSVIDPEATFSLPPRQVGNGIVDTFAHVLEQYLTYPANAPVQDRFAESILLTLLEIGPKTYADPNDYDARAALCWASTQALNGWIGQGVPQDWSTHMIGHEITALTGMDHGQTLAVVFPAIMEFGREFKRAKLLQYAGRVWGVRSGAEDERIDAAIAKTRAFFESVGVPTRFKAYGVNGAEIAPKIAERFAKRGWAGLGESHKVTPESVPVILSHSL
jgi:NADP-dependent alcohol dehydrogenase